MNQLVKTGMAIVMFALLFYSLGIITEQKKKVITQKILLFLSLGLIADITATVFMVLGSSQGPVSLHGFIGYSSLTGMLIDNILLWRLLMLRGLNAEVTKKLHLYSRYAYVWWIIAFLTGGILVAIR